MTRKSENYIILTFMLLGVFQASFAAEKSAEKLYLQGLSDNQKGQLISASVVLTEAIAVDDSRPEYFVQRGLSFIGMGQVEKGMKDYQTAVDLKTENLNVYLALTRHYMDKYQYPAVLILTDQLIANIPDQSAGGYFDKGRAYEAMGDSKSTVKAYQASLAHLDDDQAEFKQLLLEKITTIERDQ